MKLSIMKRYFLDFFLVLVVVAAAIFAWHGILNQTIEGEGFYYFAPGVSLFSVDGRLANLVNAYDNSAKIMTFIQGNLFRGNMRLYMLAMFLFIILISVCFYIFVRKFTKNSTIAFLAAFYEVLYFTGDAQFYARGAYQWFYQRTLEIIPMFVVFYFIAKFAQVKKIKFYFISLFFFILTILWAQYTTFLTSFIPIYLLVYAITDNKIKKLNERIKLPLYSIPFIFVNYLVTVNANLGLSIIHPHQTFIQSFLLVNDAPHKILYQLAVVTIPFSVTNFFANHFGIAYQQFINSSIIPVCAFYLIIFGNLYKSRSKHLKLSIACFLSLISMLFLVVYFNRVKVYNEIQEGRYYYIPGFYIGMIYAIFIDNLFKKKTKAIVIILLAFFWIYINTNFIFKKIHDSQYYYTQTTIMLDFLKRVEPGLPENSIVFLPSPPEPGATDFLKKYYSIRNTTYIFLDVRWKSKLPDGVDKDKVFVFDFQDKFTVLDKSIEYRAKL